MNGIEKITARIEQDAQKEAEALLQAAQKQAAEIEARYQAQAAAEAVRAEEAGRKAAAQRLERLESAAEMEGRQMLLAAKQHAITKAFDRALQQLLDLPDGQYADLLAQLASHSSKTGCEEILLNARDHARVGAQVVQKANALLPGGRLTLADEPRDIKGGLVLRSGKVEVNCAFEARMRVLRETMAVDVARVLFP